MTRPSESNSNHIHAQQLRDDLSSVCDQAGASEEMSRITDAYLVRFPNHAHVLRRELAIAVSGMTSPEEAGNPKISSPPPQEELRKKDPETLGRYRIIRPLGQGGMGVVYLAEDPMMKRQVALKMLPATMSKNEDARERFRRETAACSELNHPAIVPIYEVGQEANSLYYTMRYVEGEPFRDYAHRVLHPGMDSQESTTPPQEASVSFFKQAVGLIRTTARMRARVNISPQGIEAILRVGEETARALAHAHNHGVIHRDVKPANIMVDGQGAAQLLDFGLAKSETAATMTRTGLLVGTIAYMAPEQVTDDLGDVDGRTDIYSLGVALFECLAGCRPFQGASSEALIFQTLNKPAPSPLIFVPELSRDIETIILKCLEKNPERRYATASELADDIARIRAHKKIEAQPLGPLGKILRWCEYHKAVACLIALVLILLAGIPILAWQQDYVDRQKARADFSKADKKTQEHISQYELLKEELKKVRFDLIEQERKTPDAIPATDKRKSQLLELRSRLSQLIEAIRTQTVEAEFAHARAREILGHPSPEAEERFAAFLFAQLLEAESTGDEERFYALEDQLKNTPFKDRIVGSGSLYLRTSPPGATFAIRRITRDAKQMSVPSKFIWAHGKTPIDGLDLPCGHYVVELEHPKGPRITYPIFIERGESWGQPSWHGGIFKDKDWTVPVPSHKDIDAKAWGLVPGGPFLSIVNRDTNPASGQSTWLWLDSFLMKRLEITGSEYAEFLAAQNNNEQRLLQAPFKVVPRQPDGNLQEVFMVPATTTLSPPLYRQTMLLAPVASISQRNARDFATWATTAYGSEVRLPTSLQWEKAAKGIDGRLYPWGNHFDEEYIHPCGFIDGKLVPPQPTPEDSKDRSPYGILELSGGVREWCGDGHDLLDGETTPYLVGGNAVWGLFSGRSFMVTPREFMAYDNVLFDSGIRLVMPWRAKTK